MRLGLASITRLTKLEDTDPVLDHKAAAHVAELAGHQTTHVTIILLVSTEYLVYARW